MSVIHVIYEDKHYAVPEEWAINEHPGGADDILCVRGQDMTDDFDAVGHTRDALNILKSFDNIPIMHEGDEYHINVTWLATDEGLKAGGHFKAFLDALGSGEAATTALIKEWPASAQKHIRSHYKIPTAKGAGNKMKEASSASTTTSPAQLPTIGNDTPASISPGCAPPTVGEDSLSLSAAPTPTTPATAATDGEKKEKKACCTITKYALPIAAVVVVAIVASKALAKKR